MTAREQLWNARRVFCWFDARCAEKNPLDLERTYNRGRLAAYDTWIAAVIRFRREG
jgi:hypothetical protein